MPILPAYAELHCLSNFSFLRGASHPEELVQRAMDLGYEALALTDECSLAGVVRAHDVVRTAAALAASQQQPFCFKLIIGTELQLQGGTRLVLLATNRAGYGQLSALITQARRHSPKGSYALSRSDFGSGLSACLALLLPGALPSLDDAHWLAGLFPGRTWIACELHNGPDDRMRLAAMRQLSQDSALPLVATGDVHMHLRSRRRLQDVLTAIRLRKPVQECGLALFPNGERHLRQRLRLANVYPAPLLRESLHIAARCHFSLDELKYEYPEELVPAGETSASHLRKLTERGLAWRYPQGVPTKVREVVEKELTLITELDYERFFLTVQDIVQFAASRGILHQGRGSAANSAVCYALGITAVNPQEQQLLIERFISRERKEPPDIDVDFEHQRREEIIQYIYGKYGRERAALAATVISYRRRSAVRDVGKALGLDGRQIGLLAESMAWWDQPNELAARLGEAGVDPAGPLGRRLVDFTQTLGGFPRHLSQHVGGFVISGGPLSELVPMENAAMPGRTVIQWDKNDLESLGLLKVDVLALGMLSVIRRALALVNERHGSRHTMTTLFLAQDPAVYDMMCEADTIGVFQIESRAQMSMLPRLKPRKFYDLVVEIAIVRPGPIQGGMVHPYLKRREGKEKEEYPSEAVRSVLARTLGVPIFQEQVMQLAVAAAGFSPGQADQLRRSMAAWQRKGGLDPHEAALKAGMKERGYSPEFAERIFKQIQGFGEYGFPESHSISFALLAYVSAWLKRHEPTAFLAALLNSQPMGFYAPSQLVQDACRHGVEVRGVDVTCSAWECLLEYPQAQRQGEPAVRLGLQLITGLAIGAAERIVAARRAQAFSNIEDLTRRAHLNRRDLRCLASAGALQSLAGHRRQAHWEVSGIETPTPLLASPTEASVDLAAPDEGRELVADYASLGLSLGRHPLALLRSRLTRMRFGTARDLDKQLPGQTSRVAGIVTGRQRPGTASGAIFVTLEDETGYVNVIVWNRIFERQRRELLSSRLMGVEGRLEREGKVTHVIARRLTDCSSLLGALNTPSRDFH